MRSTRRPLVLILLALAVLVLVADQLTKVWAVQSLVEGERTPLIGDLLGLSLLYNPGAALSIATGMTWLLTIVAAAVSVVILRVAKRLGSRGWTVALGLLLGGALGNLVDRLLREPGFARGHVVDFIAYGDIFVGNVADIAIVLAALLIVALSMRGIGVDGSRPVPVPADGVEPAGADLSDAAPGDPSDAGLDERPESVADGLAEATADAPSESRPEVRTVDARAEEL
ncbi:signal peptidase II [Cellulomonas sp. KRMCY2]|uniref:signal peptidase II n=1 Tax=Cellulomonas sp. KRMCY2 TaxID=1304865 RepID=UPI00045EB33E